MNLFGLTSSKSINFLGGFGQETYQHPNSIDVEEICDSKINSKVSKIKMKIKIKGFKSNFEIRLFNWTLLTKYINSIFSSK
jgi:hypothetical protein